MRRVSIHPQAEVDLLEIWHYIARDSIEAADKVIAEIERAISGLCEMRGKGHERDDVKNRSFRFISVYSYVIGYEFDADTVTIVRIIHGGRDFSKVFSERN